MIRGGKWFALFMASAVCVALPSAARADDPIPIEGLSPEMLSALEGVVPPEVLAALIAAANGQRAAQTGAIDTRRAAGTPPTTADPAVLSSLLAGTDLGAVTSSSAPPSAGRVVDLHPSDVPPPQRGPERIGPGHTGGFVDLHPEPAAESAPTVLPIVRVGARHTTRRPNRRGATRRPNR